MEFLKGEKPYLLSGADDKTIRVWDYQTKQTVFTLAHHTDNVVALLSHPSLPILFSASEDCKVKVWSTNDSFHFLQDLDFSLETPWSFSAKNNLLAVAYDMGTLVIKVGPDYSIIDHNNAKLIYAKNHEIFYANLNALNLADI